MEFRVNPGFQWILIDNLLLIAGWADLCGPDCAGRVASVRWAADTSHVPQTGDPESRARARHQWTLDTGPEAPTAHQRVDWVRQLASGPDSVYKPNIQSQI